MMKKLPFYLIQLKIQKIWLNNWIHLENFEKNKTVSGRSKLWLISNNKKQQNYHNQIDKKKDEIKNFLKFT